MLRTLIFGAIVGVVGKKLYDEGKLTEFKEQAIDRLKTEYPGLKEKAEGYATELRGKAKVYKAEFKDKAADFKARKDAGGESRSAA